ncbi:MAG: hypothetical protein L0H31_05895 [Nocardioidaceae bacterium]|nr:hypothetical protein [Nocardioidaceae bacterium]
MMRKLMVMTLACLILFTTVACDGDPPPRGASEPTISATTETSASTTTEKKLGPVQVVKAWYRALNQLIKDGDATDARALITAECWTCEEQIDPIAKTFTDGGTYRLKGPGWDLKRVSTKTKRQRFAVINAAYAGAPGKLVPSKGANPIAFEAEHSVVEVRLVKQPRGWRIKFIGYLE